jgi:hydrogenase nickel incorporation protein HypB
VEEIRLIEVKEEILSDNIKQASEVRERLRKTKTMLLNLMSSPGSGKTSLILRTLEGLRGTVRLGVIEADIQSTVDAERVAARGIPVIQLRTGGFCHLDATMVTQGIDAMAVSELDLVIIENVGNLVCPANYDLGEHLRIVMMSVTEGEDKPLKYPTIFHTADLAVITKADLAAACEFDAQTARANIAAVRPGVPILEVSSKSGAGFDAWFALLDRGAGGKDVPGSAR